MVLPLVLIGMLLMGVMSVALQQSAWRAARGARSSWDAQRGLYAADEAVVRHVATWSPDSMAATPVGTALTWTEVSADGWRTRTSLVRTAALIAIAHAVTDRAHSAAPAPARLGDAMRIQRTVLRALRLEAPRLPVRGAVTVLGDVDYGNVNIDGRDSVVAFDGSRDDCGPLRDTASLPALVSGAPRPYAAPVLAGALVHLNPTGLAQDRAAFDSAFTAIATRASTMRSTVPGAIPVAPPWRAVVIQSPGTVTLDSAIRHRGLLVFDGDIVVRGSLTVDGLLVVRGSLDASAGSLTVRGALVVRDVVATGTRLGAGVRIRLAPCLVGRALVAVSVPRAAPFGVWNAP
jgi:hypothetical protein